MGDAADRLIALAGRIHVEGHRRRSKSGKTTQVSAHTRSPSSMSVEELTEELKDLTGSSKPSERNRAAQLQSELRARRIESKVEPGRKRRVGVHRNLQGQKKAKESGEWNKGVGHDVEPTKPTQAEIEAEAKKLGVKTKFPYDPLPGRTAKEEAEWQKAMEDKHAEESAAAMKYYAERDKAKGPKGPVDDPDHKLDPEQVARLKTKSIVQNRKAVFQAALEGRATLVPAGARDNKTAEVYIDGKLVGQASTLMHSVREDPDDPKSKTTFGERRLVPAYSWKLSGDEEKAALEYERSKAPKPKPGSGHPGEGTGAVSKADSDSFNVSASKLRTAKDGDKVTVSFEGNHAILTKRADGRWHKGTIDKKGRSSAELMAEVEKLGDKVKAFRMGDRSPGPFDNGRTLPGGKKKESLDTSVKKVLAGKGGTMGAVAEGLSEMGLGKNPKKKGSLAKADDAKPGETFREYMARHNEADKKAEAEQTEKALEKVRKKQAAAAIAKDGPFPTWTIPQIRREIKTLESQNVAPDRVAKLKAEIKRRQAAAKKAT